MIAIETGEYWITFYTRKGTKIRELTELVKCLTDGIEMGEETLITEKQLDHTPLAESFTIDRRTYNSLDRTTKWDTQ